MNIPDLPFLAELTALRRDLHAHPELAFDENRTAEVVARELERYGLEVYRGIARTVRRHGRILAQPGAELVELLFGLVELGVGQAQPGHQGAQVQDGGLGDTCGHRDGRLP